MLLGPVGTIPTIPPNSGILFNGARRASAEQYVGLPYRYHKRSTMALYKPYLDIPGTTVFDTDQAAKGYHLNQFAVSLMKAENRERFRADADAYLDGWPMTEAQKQAVRDRDYNRMIGLGGNIYFVAKIGATDGLTYVQIDLTLVNDMPVDHGCTVPLSIMFGQPDAWPCTVVPLVVNVVQYPVPSGRRCLELGKAVRRAVESFDEDLDVQVWGTGGMSHQLQGPRAGLINQPWDNEFLDRIVDDPEGQAAVEHVEYVREAGSEGIELVMWLVARGAMADLAGGGAPTEVHRLYHVPASNTAVGQLILEDALA